MGNQPSTDTFSNNIDLSTIQSKEEKVGAPLHGCDFKDNSLYTNVSSYNPNIYVALFDFESEVENQVSIKKGEQFNFIRQDCTGRWSWVTLKTDLSPLIPHKTKGWVPTAYIAPVNVLDKFPWYHGSFSRTATESHLSSGIDGSFLVRESESYPGHLSISLLSEGVVHHYCINKEDNSFFIYPNDKFGSVAELVHHHSLKSSGLICCLLYPMNKLEPCPLVYRLPYSTSEKSSLEERPSFKDTHHRLDDVPTPANKDGSSFPIDNLSNNNLITSSTNDTSSSTTDMSKTSLISIDGNYSSCVHINKTSAFADDTKASADLGTGVSKSLINAYSYIIDNSANAVDNITAKDADLTINRASPCATSTLADNQIQDATKFETKDNLGRSIAEASVNNQSEGSRARIKCGNIDDSNIIRRPKGLAPEPYIQNDIREANKRRSFSESDSSLPENNSNVKINLIEGKHVKPSAPPFSPPISKNKSGEPLNLSSNLSSINSNVNGIFSRMEKPNNNTQMADFNPRSRGLPNIPSLPVNPICKGHNLKINKKGSDLNMDERGVLPLPTSTGDNHKPNKLGNNCKSESEVGRPSYVIEQVNVFINADGAKQIKQSNIESKPKVQGIDGDSQSRSLGKFCRDELDKPKGKIPSKCITQCMRSNDRLLNSMPGKSIEDDWASESNEFLIDSDGKLVGNQGVVNSLIHKFGGNKENDVNAFNKVDVSLNRVRNELHNDKNKPAFDSVANGGDNDRVKVALIKKNLQNNESKFCKSNTDCQAKYLSNRNMNIGGGRCL